MLNKEAAKECCNYDREHCLGAMFKCENGSLKHWIDKDKKGEYCNQGNCDFFKSYVIPTLKGTIRGSRRLH